MFKIKPILSEANPGDIAPPGNGSAPPPNSAPPSGDAANQAWFPEAHKGFVETKGWKAPGDVLESYVNLEKLIGADRAGRTVVLPKDENDAEGMKAFRAKLGVPETPEAYELPLPEGDNGEFAKTAASWMHKAGVPKAAAQDIAKNWNEHMKALVQASEVEAQQKAEQELSTLKSQWGQDFAKNEELARRGLREIGKGAGLDDNDIGALESTLGTAKMLKMFVELGKANAEPGFAGNGSPGFGINKSQAQTKLNEINGKRASGEITDKQWKDTYEAEVAKLAEIVYGS